MKRVIIDNNVVRVSKPGCSAESSDLNDFLLHENFNIDIAVGGLRYASTLPATIPHNLGYKPVFFIAGSSMGVGYSLPCPVYAYADEMNIYVKSYRNPDGSLSVWYQPSTPIPIIILAEPQP